MTAEEINVIITAQNEQFNRKIDEVTKELDQMKRSSESAVASTSSMFTGLAGLISSLGLAKLIGQCNSAYETQMLNELKLTTIMKQRMNATDAEVESIKRLASAQQQIGVVGDEVQLAGAQQLATFATSTKTISTLIPAMNNLMVQQNGLKSTTSSAVSVANMMGKALQGQVSALSRVGISFTEAQENVLKYGTEEQKAATLAQVITDNVGEMNKALRNTSLGELQALKNDIGDFMEEIGAEIQPAISAVLPLVRELFVTARPLLLDITEGATKATQALSQMSPETRRLVTLALAASVAIPAVTKAVRLLNISLTSTTGILGAIFGVLALISLFKDMSTAVSNTTEDFSKESEGADEAAASVDGLADSMEQLGETTKKSLADIDTLNVFGSGGSLASSIVTPADLENLDSAAEAVKDIQKNADIELGLDFSLDSLYETIQNVWTWLTTDAWSELKIDSGLFLTALFGTGDDQYNALKSLNAKIEKIFGPEFTAFWQGVGADIAKVFSGDEGEVYKGLQGLNDKFKSFFGDFGKDWSDFWTKIGEGIFDFANGDLLKGLDKINEQFKGLFGDIGEEWSKFWMGIGNWIQENQSPAQFLYNAITGKFDGGSSGKFGDYSYQNFTPATNEDYLSGSRETMGGGGGMRRYSDSATEQQPFIIYNNNTIELDGDVVGEYASTYDSREQDRSNGY